MIPVPPVLYRVLAGVGALAAAYLIGDHNGANRVKHRVAAERSAANEKVLTTDSRAKEAAAVERAADTATISNTQAEQVQSYANENDPAAVRIRAACQRLRAQRGVQAALPVECGPEGRAGAPGAR